jgi:hypothetical protein
MARRQPELVLERVRHLKRLLPATGVVHLSPVCCTGRTDVENTLKRHAKTHSSKRGHVHRWDTSFSAVWAVGQVTGGTQASRRRYLLCHTVPIFEFAFLLEGYACTIARASSCLPLHAYPSSASRETAKAGGGGDGLATPAGVYHGDRRSRIAGTPRIPGGGESHPAPPDHGPCAPDGW